MPPKCNTGTGGTKQSCSLAKLIPAIERWPDNIFLHSFQHETYIDLKKKNQNNIKNKIKNPPAICQVKGVENGGHA